MQKQPEPVSARRLLRIGAGVGEGGGQHLGGRRGYATGTPSPSGQRRSQTVTIVTTTGFRVTAGKPPGLGCSPPFSNPRSLRSEQGLAEEVRGLEQKLPATPGTGDTEVAQAQTATPKHCSCSAKHAALGHRTRCILPGWGQPPGMPHTGACHQVDGGPAGQELQGTWQGHSLCCWRPGLSQCSGDRKRGWLQRSSGTPGVCQEGVIAGEVQAFGLQQRPQLPLCSPKTVKRQPDATRHMLGLVSGPQGSHTPGWPVPEARHSRGWRGLPWSRPRLCREALIEVDTGAVRARGGTAA